MDDQIIPPEVHPQQKPEYELSMLAPKKQHSSQPLPHYSGYENGQQSANQHLPGYSQPHYNYSESNGDTGYQRHTYQPPFFMNQPSEEDRRQDVFCNSEADPVYHQLLSAPEALRNPAPPTFFPVAVFTPSDVNDRHQDPSQRTTALHGDVLSEGVRIQITELIRARLEHFLHPVVDNLDKRFSYITQKLSKVILQYASEYVEYFAAEVVEICKAIPATTPAKLYALNKVLDKDTHLQICLVHYFATDPR